MAGAELVPIRISDLVLLYYIKKIVQKNTPAFANANAGFKTTIQSAKFPRVKQPKVLSTKNLLAKAGEPPGVMPTVAATADEHAALVIVEAVESGVTPLATGIFPVSGIGVIVREGRVGFVDGRERVRIGGYEAAQFVLLVEVVVADIAAKVEEDDLRLFAFAAGHGVHDRAVGVLRAAGGVDCLLWSAGAVDGDAADNQVADRLHACTERSQALHAKVLDSKNLLDGIERKLRTMPAHRGAELVDQILHLTVGHRLRCDHDLGHGVIPFL
ncbi:MAG: hypothetical protein A3D44_02170 [Candidatus Staskawiczbacteria bacterium RIFCSPHIGHO2_02_FULL_42_22]|uniref:Uncharacterized protein n=1 Tax=Candidatus Staskawiczbacteria bacterium RIFCSPHIGHO2_02_FULL_42_22 TaxID=1802207 RepID=A0A1G2I286_9BACT|nr:MAG: hypothetical protein A3D44_02170 [Candidatus Staskawiczbacteria bacterium RIFCSPHIGHO2_02_FULL_42_22]